MLEIKIRIIGGGYIVEGSMVSEKFFSDSWDALNFISKKIASEQGKKAIELGKNISAVESLG